MLTVYPSPLNSEKIPILTCHHLVLLFEEILLGLMITEVYKHFKEIEEIAILKRYILYLTLNKVVENCIITTGETNECWFTNYMEWQPCGCDTGRKEEMGKHKSRRAPPNITTWLLKCMWQGVQHKDPYYASGCESGIPTMLPRCPSQRSCNLSWLLHITICWTNKMYLSPEKRHLSMTASPQANAWQI